MRRRLPLLAALACLALAAPAGAARTPAGFTYESACQGFGSFFAADAVTVRRLGAIPTRFHLAAEQSGRAYLLIASWVCDFTVGGRTDRGASYSHVSALLDEPAAGLYDIWQFTDSRAFARPPQRLGVFTAHLRGLQVRFGDATPTVAANAVVPWHRSPYTMTGTLTATTPTLPLVESCRPEEPALDARGCFPSDHWFNGRRGVAHATHANCDLGVATGIVTLHTRPTTPLAQMLGTAEVTQPGAVLRFRGRVHHDLADRYPDGTTPRLECPAP